VRNKRVSEREGATSYGPPYYRAPNGLQPWDVIDAFELDYYLGSVAKYLLRAGRKDGASRLGDLWKAQHFLARAIELEEAKK
jgi:hypothetical protein